ncbi:MAG: NAD(+) synthase [Pirellulales bacterium]|nr:NAD(+) synthase [Pirellulales bacterium]
MKLIRVAAAALNQIPLDWDGNAAHIRRAIELARARQVSLLCLPELCLTGYGCEDAFLSAAVVRRAERVLAELLPDTEGMAVSIGLPVMQASALFNASAMLVDGRLVGLVAKQHLAGDGLHYEPRWFKPWPAGVVVSAKLAGSICPFGDVLFDFDGVRIGFEICEDAWVADRPGEHHVALGADIILNPSASHFALGKTAMRQQLVSEASRAYGVSYIYSNLLGNEAGRVIYDGETIVASAGHVLARGPRLGYDSAVVTDAVIDLDGTRMRRAQSANYQPALAADTSRVVDVRFSLPNCSPDPPVVHAPTWENVAEPLNEEFARAIALGLFDYLRKSRSRGFVVSLSGGADSSAVASLVAIMVRLGVAQLGRDEFCRAIGFRAETPPADDEVAPLVHELLTTVYQATGNSSDTTRNAARDVARAIGATHLELDVDDLFRGYVSKVEAALGRTLTWERDDLALQNIQARTRGPSVWLIANVKGALLLATSNRSEAAVGYATMDGDTCGGISPIAGIDKAFIRRWLRWLEVEGPFGVGPVPALRAVNVQAPTAELRPPAEGQTDEADLMPYDLLDAIEDQAIGERRSPQEVLDTIAAANPQYAREQLARWVRRFFELWSRNQWKRERYAPSLHVDDKNLDPKTWCRFPILSGGFRRELAELDDHRRE